MLCSIGFHAWQGCRCQRAGCTVTRDEQHRWEGCKCGLCNKILPEHDKGHVWQACRCRVCHTVLDPACDFGHDWTDNYEDITNSMLDRYGLDAEILGEVRAVLINKKCRICNQINWGTAEIHRDQTELEQRTRRILKTKGYPIQSIRPSGINNALLAAMRLVNEGVDFSVEDHGEMVPCGGTQYDSAGWISNWVIVPRRE